VVRSVGNAEPATQETSAPGVADGGATLADAGQEASTRVTSAPALASQPPAAAPDRPAEASAARRPSPPAPAPQAEQVAHAVIERVERGGGEARIHLDPPDLGEVTIRVAIDGDHVRLEVHAARPEAAHLLREHTVDLSSLLGSRGLDLVDVYVGTEGRQGQQQPGAGSQSRREPATGPSFASVLGLDVEPEAVRQHNRLRQAYNPDGAHLYRI
jgi:flagellar hook-length control protein FliK